MNLYDGRAELHQPGIECGAVIVRQRVARQDSCDSQHLGAWGVHRKVDLVRGVRGHAHHELVQPHGVARLPFVQQVDVQPARRQRGVTIGETRHGGSQHLLVLPRPRGMVGKEIHELGEPSGKRGCATRHARADHPESGDFFPCMTLDMPWRILTTPPPSVFSRLYAARNIPSRSTLCPAFR